MAKRSISLVSSAVPTFSHPSDHRFPLSEGCRVFIFLSSRPNFSSLGFLEASVAYLVVAFFLLAVDALGLSECQWVGPLVGGSWIFPVSPTWKWRWCAK
ncbi:hypothetical protein IGI04_036449, partial [Brassica rapa subsp. trilocularis]